MSFSALPNQINVFLFSPYLISLITVDHTPAKLPVHKPLVYFSDIFDNVLLLAPLIKVSLPILPPSCSQLSVFFGLNSS